MPGLLSLLVAGAAFWFAWRLAWDLRRARNWPVVPGKIVERGLVMMRQRSYAPRVKYTYAVGAREYASDQVYLLGRMGGPRAKMQAFIDALPDPVPVRYDPANPARACLVENPAWMPWLFAVCGVFATIFGIMRLVTA